jgi:hypothetical protein
MDVAYLYLVQMEHEVRCIVELLAVVKAHSRNVIAYLLQSLRFRYYSLPGLFSAIGSIFVLVTL